MQEITRLTDLHIKLDDMLTNYNEQADLLADTKELLVKHLDSMDDMSKVDRTLEQIDGINKEINHVNNQITVTREQLNVVANEIDDAENRPE
jgi:peptidoglycan hydrolase CwlO-like protein